MGKQRAFEITMTKYYKKEYKIMVIGNYDSEEAKDRGLMNIDKGQCQEHPLVYIDEYDEFDVEEIGGRN